MSLVIEFFLLERHLNLYTALFRRVSTACEPAQAINDELVLNIIGELKGKLFVGFVIIVNVIVPHVHIDHLIVFICPCHRIVTGVPYFALLRSCAQRKVG